MAKDKKIASAAGAGASGNPASAAAAAADEKRRVKAERRQTPGDRSRARMKQYALIALALGCSLPLLVPILSRLLLWINPPTFTELIDPTAQQLHSVFFSGKPHIVFCTNRTGSELPRLVKRVADAADDYAIATEVKAPTPIPVLSDDDDDEETSPVQAAYNPDLTRAEQEKLVKEGWFTSALGPVSVVTLDCAAPLPSGLSVLQRFKLQLPVVQVPPTPVGSLATTPLPPALWVANGDRPTWIPSELFTTEDRVMPSKVLSHVVSKALPRTQAIQSEKVLARDCTGSRKHCVLILHAGALALASPAVTSTVRAIHHHFPFIKVVSVDVSGYTLGLQKNLGKLDHGPAAGANGQWPRMLYFRRQALTNATATDKEKQAAAKQKKPATAAENKAESTLLVKSYKGRFSPLPVLHFLSALSDSPRFDSAGSAILPAPSTGARAMAKLKASPQLNSGANNFRKAKLPPRGVTSDGRQIPTRKEQQDARWSRDEERKARAASKESAEREERERAMRRREQMEAEAAESNFVTEAVPEPDATHHAHDTRTGGYTAGGGGFSADDASAEESDDGSEEDEETVNLDEESEL